MKYDTWLQDVKRMAGSDFEYYSEWYSFYTAWKEGKTPKQAYDDCHEWMTA